ncbi:MAG: CoA-binding protein, partial [Pseudomonadota bacterium]
MADLARLLNPKSICFVGGGQMEGPILASRRAGYEGQIYVVNPKRSEIAGIACYPSIADLPEAPDAAMVGLSPARSVEAVAALSKRGAGGAVVIVSGFAETGEAGHDLQKRLIDGAGEMPLLGPNCMGFINQFSGAAIWADDTPIARQDGPAAALISQSGALMIGMLGVEQAFPVGYAASIGNQAKTTIGDLIHGILMDERIRVIGLYLEGINDGAVLGEACQAALSKGVPVIALKGGDGEAAEKVALSHTASMVVERDLWTAFKRRFGVVEVSSPKALVETLKLLTLGEAAKGNRLSLASYSGGFNGLAANRAASLGLALPAPSTGCHDRMEAVLPADVAIGNPFDLNIPFSAREG